MEKTMFEYDYKWETVSFEAPAKKIILFEDVPKF